MVERKKKALFSFLKDRLWKRIQHWSGRHLSKAVREVLVKSVAQAIPTYCMSVFLISTSLGEEMERMINSFWWGSNRGGGKGINWMSWEQLSVRKDFGGMGFRHFEGFNLAMLGKQGWRIATNQDTIFSRVFKAKYFPKAGFLGARLGHNSSFVWRGAHSSHVLVKSGARWKIGNGRNINVWRDPWLRNCDDPYVKSPIIFGREDMRVEELIDHAHKSWRLDVLSICFNQQEVNTISKMPIMHAAAEDKLTWDNSKTGSYNVRSGYHKLMEEIVDQSHLKLAGSWRRLWQAKVPQKYKIFLWRAMRNVLPTRQNLSRRGVNCSNLCPHCGLTAENSWHALYYCSKAKECWKLEDCGLSCQILSNELKCIWRRRNDKVWNKLEINSSTAVALSREFLHSWCKARSSKGDMQWHISSVLDLIWQKPQAGSLKCNYDAVLFNAKGVFGIGLCVRDSDRIFRKAKTMWFLGSPTPKEVEAIGLLEAIKWVHEEEFTNIIFELDCKAVVEDIINLQLYNNELGSILDNCRECLKLVQNYEVSYVKRQANFVAHSLARASRLYASHQVFNSIPSCIDALIMNEMA